MGVIGCRTLSQDCTHVCMSMRGVESRADERIDMRLKSRVDLAAVMIEKEESSQMRFGYGCWCGSI